MDVLQSFPKSDPAGMLHERRGGGSENVDYL